MAARLFPFDQFLQFGNGPHQSGLKWRNRIGRSCRLVRKDEVRIRVILGTETAWRGLEYRNSPDPISYELRRL